MNFNNYYYLTLFKKFNLVINIFRQLYLNIDIKKIILYIFDNFILKSISFYYYFYIYLYIQIYYFLSIYNLLLLFELF